MKIESTVCASTPDALVAALSSTEFASTALTQIAEVLGVKNVLYRPAEFCVQKANTGPLSSEGLWGVQVNLSGVSRGDRTPEQFYKALGVLNELVQTTVLNALTPYMVCQVFCTIEIDEPIPTTIPGVYSKTLESKANTVKKV